MSTVLDTRLYAQVKKEADAKFVAPTSAYKSAWIVRTYKQRGGQYSPKRNSTTGLTKWFDDEWVDLQRPVKDSQGRLLGYRACGRRAASSQHGLYPVCRPLSVAEKMTPAEVRKACKEKQNKMQR